MKTALTGFSCFILQVFLLAQSPNNGPSETKWKYSFLTDTILPNGEIIEVVHESNRNYSKTFKKISGRYKPVVLITKENYYLYNEEALKIIFFKKYNNLLAQYSITAANDLNEKEFHMWFSKMKIIGVPYFDSEAGSIYRDDYIYFRTLSLLESKDESTRIEYNKESNTFLSNYSSGFYIDGYPVIIKEKIKCNGNETILKMLSENELNLAFKKTNYIEFIDRGEALWEGMKITQNEASTVVKMFDIPFRLINDCVTHFKVYITNDQMLSEINSDTNSPWEETYQMEEVNREGRRYQKDGFVTFTLDLTELKGLDVGKNYNLSIEGYDATNNRLMTFKSSTLRFVPCSGK